MNPQNDPIAAYQNDIGQWEHAINCYNGQDPLDLWFRYICWLESNVNATPALEAKFRKAVEQCLSTYDKFDNYKQDLRMVKLWIKYIDFQPNPLNLYKILYQQGIGTTVASFYIGWAHYYNSSNLFKQAESIFNLGIQLKAQPIVELENAQKSFRFSVAQRMLYNDESSKKRTISSLAEQRQQITSLSPHQNQPQPSKRIKIDAQEDQQQQPDGSVQQQYSSSEDYQYASTSSDPGYVISSSLNYVYNDSNVYGVAEEPVVEQPITYTFENGFQMPPNFINFARNSHETWNVALCLEEPYDPNQRCFYPKHLVYPGDNQEFSLEELRAQKWRAKIEEKQKQDEIRVQQEELRKKQEAERLRQVQEAKRLIEEQEKLQKEQGYPMTYQQPNPAWNCHNQSPASYGSYYQHSYENSPQYTYSHDHIYQTHYAQQNNMYQHSPHSYQNSPNYLQQHPPLPQSVIVNRSQYETQHVQQPPAGEYYQQPQHQYAGTSYQGYHQVPAAPQNPVPPPVATPVTQQQPQQPTQLQQQPQKFRDSDYQDVEYLIDHQGEIDPKILQQPIVESFEESSYEESDEEEAYNGPAPVVNSYMLDDLEEQIEASTISFSSNGKSRDKKITIKFRKEKTTTTIVNSESNSESSQPPVRGFAIAPKSSLEPLSASSSSSGKKKSRKQKFQNEILNTFDGDSTQFMPSATNSCSSTANSEINSSSFSNVNFKGCVTPVRKPASKISTPVSTYKFLRKPESVISNQNDDSICSYNGDQNSFFQAENDDDFKGRRMERAVASIEEHLKKRDIDPFNSELCRAFLIKLNFPNREPTTDYKITNMNLPKLFKNQVVPLGGVTYQIEKEVGRGSYGAVYRGINTNDGSVVALKYQKPPNSWELYICTEVRRRLKNVDIVRNFLVNTLYDYSLTISNLSQLPGFMSISAAVIAPNASVLVSEFSQYGSLLDINNRIRQATTKVMNESLVMHFAVQILSIISHLHACNIIHADIKPDNFLLMTL
jgi:checkpoint serine/threonine-protein kinase